VAVYIYTQTIHRTTQITTEKHKYKLMWKSAGRAPFFEFYPGFFLQLRKKHGKTSVRVRKTARVRKTPDGGHIVARNM
jgi:hypothetical protein